MDNNKNINTIATIVAIIAGFAEIYGFFFTDEEHLKLLIIILFAITIFSIYLTNKMKKDTENQLKHYEENISKLKTELENTKNDLINQLINHKEDLAKHEITIKNYEKQEENYKETISQLESKLDNTKSITKDYKIQLSELDLELYNKETEIETIIKNNIDKSPEIVKKTLESNMQDYVSTLSKIISLHSNDKVNVTLRLLAENNIKDIGKTLVVPIALSKTINSSRKKVFNANNAATGRVVRNNTDFSFILDDRVNTYFYCQDLTKYQGYQNENLQYLDFYKGKIVLPINYYGNDAAEFGYFHTIANSSFSTLGFIIADTLNENLFTEDAKDYYLNLLELYAKKSAILLRDYKYCLKKLKIAN